MMGLSLFVLFVSSFLFFSVPIFCFLLCLQLVFFDVSSFVFFAVSSFVFLLYFIFVYAVSTFVVF